MTMTRDNTWGTPSKVFISDKPLLDGNVDLSSIDEDNFKEFDLEVHNFEAKPIGEPEYWHYNIADFNQSISIDLEMTMTPKQMRNIRKMLRIPKLPRKLKKMVKKTYFDTYPKRMSRQMLNFAFAMNNPNKANKVGLQIVIKNQMSYVPNQQRRL